MSYEFIKCMKDYRDHADIWQSVIGRDCEEDGERFRVCRVIDWCSRGN